MTLIHATTREFKLTEAGEKLYALLQHSYEAVETMLRDTEEFIKDKYEPQGTIRVVLPIGVTRGVKMDQLRGRNSPTCMRYSGTT